MRSRVRAEAPKGTQAGNHHLSRLGLSAHIEPQDCKGQSRVNRGLCLLRVDPEDSKTGLPPAQQAAGIDRSEGSLEVD
jgi:hypothetical protein